MYIHIYILYICVYIGHIPIYIYIHIHKSYTHIYIYIHREREREREKHKHAHTHTCARAQSHTQTNTHTYTHIHTHTRTHTHRDTGAVVWCVWLSNVCLYVKAEQKILEHSTYLRVITLNKTYAHLFGVITLIVKETMHILMIPHKLEGYREKHSLVQGASSLSAPLSPLFSCVLLWLVSLLSRFPHIGLNSRFAY